MSRKYHVYVNNDYHISMWGTIEQCRLLTYEVYDTTGCDDISMRNDNGEIIEQMREYDDSEVAHTIGMLCDDRAYGECNDAPYFDDTSDDGVDYELIEREIYNERDARGIDSDLQFIRDTYL